MSRLGFEGQVRLHKDAVYRQMIRVCNHREDAEDALATALLLAFKSYDRLESDEAFRTWLGTIGKRVCTLSNMPKNTI
jgi:DNA-directed RNA polymerase specialized sigma24 family protein